MANVLEVIRRCIAAIFTTQIGNGNTRFTYILKFITNNPYLFVGTVLLIIGFSVGLLKRIIHS